MTHDFIINTENVNRYGYRILTDGIETAQYERNPVVLFMHERESNWNSKKGSAVIGKCVKLTKKDNQLIATIEFDEEDDFAKTIAGKVERGFIRMASIYADVVETSDDETLVMVGQRYHTVTKCILNEISIVDIGGNDDALKLSHGKEVNFLPPALKLNLKNDNMNLKTIALALQLPTDASEDVILAAVQKAQADKKASDDRVVQLQLQLSAIKTGEATTLVDKAVKLGLIPEALKDSQIKAFDADFDGQKVVLTKLIEDKEAADLVTGVSSKLKEVILGANGSKPAGTENTESFDYLQKHNPVKLAGIRKNDPQAFEKLVADYTAGVRYTN